MKKRFGRKSLALVLALSIESGSIPIKPVDDLFGVMPVKANAEETGIISGQNDEKAAEGDSAALITGTCGENATWKLDFDTGKLTISGTGAMDDFNLGYQPWKDYRDYITSVEIEKGITSLGKCAFYECKNLTSITIPDSVTSFDNWAFEDCKSLKSITIPDSVTSFGARAFAYCTSLKSITIPDSVTSFGVLVFCGCRNLTSVVFSGDTSIIGERAFEDCTSLTFIGTPAIVAPTATTLTYNGNEQELVTAGTTNFGTMLYSLDGENYSEDIPKKTDAGTYIIYYKIDEDDYYFAPQMVEVTIADSYTITWKNGDETLETDNYVPSGATPEYNSQTPSKDATAQYTYSFIGWSDGTNTYANDELPSVSGDVTYTAQFNSTARVITGKCGENATWKLDLDTGKLTISGAGAMYTSNNQQWNKYREYITSVEIEKGIAYISDYAFSDLTRLTSITIPDSVTSIGEGAFFNCTSLTSITIPKGVTSIGKYTFAYCESLTSITIPDSVTSIGNDAFYFSTGITDVYCYADPNKLTWDWEFEMECSSVWHIPVKYLKVYNARFEIMYGRNKNVTFKAIPDVIPPMAYSLTYNSNEQELVTTGYTNYGTLLYSLDGENYSEDIPKETNTGTYTVYYKVDEDDYYFAPQTVEVTIADSYTITWKNGDEILETDNFVPGGATPEYNGTTPAKDATAEYTYSFIGWSDGTNTYAPDELPSVSGDVTYTAQFNSTARVITGKCGENATWELDPGTGKLTISGTGAMDDYDSFSDNPWIKYQSYITSVEIDKGITYIGKKAFLVCLGLTSISIPDSVSSIGDYAFDNCKSLSSVTIPDSVSSIGDYAFEICTSLTSVTLPDSITSIGNNTFAYCENLTSITIPDNVTSIGNNAFYNCKSLSSITIPDSVKSIGVQTFALCESLSSITIPDSITNIDGGAFAVCTSLSSITIPGSVTSIGSNAFAYCTGLTSITIPDSVTSIGDSAFAACTGLTSISISDSITSIDDYAFRDCKGLTSITIPDSVTSIGIDAFHGCKSITDVYCYADPAKLTWNDCNCDDFIMTPKHTTVCHVPAKYLAGYNTKFGDNVNVNFKGIPAPAVTAPTANTLSYNSNEQELVTAGSTNFGTLLYSIDGTNYSKDIPKGTDAGTYIVYYKVDEDDYYFAPQTVEVTIADSYTITWKNGDEILETDNFVPGGAAPEYNGTTPAKDATAEYTYSFIGWSDGTNTYANDELPSVSGDVTYTAQFDSTARDYIITYMVDGEVYDTKTESYGNAISLPDEPSREGYTFSGWQTSNTTMPAQNIEITGTFTKNQDDDPYVDVVQYGDDSDNNFKSGSGRDHLYGGGGNDVLDGGKGDDYLQGDHGDDTYIFRSGYGNDVISESSGNNTVKIYDYSADQMVTTRNAQNDLIIKFKNSEDTLTITRFFDFNSNRDFNFEFENGTVIGQHDMPVHNSLITGTDENNYLNGTEINDIIDGGLGNDSLNGFGGEDTYIFGRGYGEDMINEWGSDHSFVDLKDINSDAVTVSDQWGSNLLISVNDSEDVLTVSNFKWGQASYTFRFADGAEGYVDRNTWELVLTKQPENNVIVIIE